MSVESVKDIPIPEGLSPIELSEFNAYKIALCNLEEEWIQLQNGENDDQKTCISVIQEIKEKRTKQANERLNLRREIIEKQTERERERIEQEKDEYKRILFDRLIRSYHQAYQTITVQLKDLMGKEYGQFIAMNGIDWPNMPSESAMRTRMQPPDEVKIRLSPPEVDADVRRIQQIIQETDD